MTKTAGTLTFEDIEKRIDIFNEGDDAIRGILTGIEYATGDTYSNAMGEVICYTRVVRLTIKVLDSTITIEPPTDQVIYIIEKN